MVRQANYRTDLLVPLMQYTNTLLSWLLAWSVGDIGVRGAAELGGINAAEGRLTQEGKTLLKFWRC